MAPCCRENVDYVVLDDALKGADLHARVSAISVEVARIGPVSVRRLGDGHRFAEERIPAPDLSTAGATSRQAPRPAGRRGNEVEAPASVAVPVLKGAKYRYVADARCADGPAPGRLQVNWLRADGQLARADIDVLRCTPEGATTDGRQRAADAVQVRDARRTAARRWSLPAFRSGTDANMNNTFAARIAVVIPSFRVTRHVLGVISSMPPLVSRIYVVDDACPDRSGDYVEQHNIDPRVRVLRHAVNQGVGGGHDGYQAAIDEGVDVIIKIDGDGQMDPALIPDFVQPILDGEADYTKGNRFAGA